MSDEEVEQLDDDLDGRIANLAGALISLQDLDTEPLSEKRKRNLARMKRQIFDTLFIYCEALLPTSKEDN